MKDKLVSQYKVHTSLGILHYNVIAASVLMKITMLCLNVFVYKLKEELMTQWKFHTVGGDYAHQRERWAAHQLN